MRDIAAGKCADFEFLADIRGELERHCKRLGLKVLLVSTRERNHTPVGLTTVRPEARRASPPPAIRLP